jgi:hypothetical protein
MKEWRDEIDISEEWGRNHIQKGKKMMEMGVWWKFSYICHLKLQNYCGNCPLSL